MNGIPGVLRVLPRGLQASGTAACTTTPQASLPPTDHDNKDPVGGVDERHPTPAIRRQREQVALDPVPSPFLSNQDKVDFGPRLLSILYRSPRCC